MQPIVVFPDPLLRKEVPVSAIGAGEPIKGELEAALRDLPVNWLTAKHLGAEARIIVIKANDKTEVLIDPRIEKLSGGFSSRVEADASFPGMKTSVLRRNYALVSHIDSNGKRVQSWFDDVSSRLIQQAVEQLAGKLMIDHVNGHRKRSIKGYLGRLEKGKFTAPYPTRSSILVDNE